MAETLHIPEQASKEQVYESILPQISALIEGEQSLIANLANITAVLDTAFSHLWTGFYLMEENMLVLGPFRPSRGVSTLSFFIALYLLSHRSKGLLSS